VNVFLVEHPAGLLLFDTGQQAEAAESGYFPRWHPFFRLARFELGPEDEIAAQLAERGVRPGDVRWVLLSHLHTDHVGGLAPFAGADVLVSRVEWERATAPFGRLHGHLPRHWPQQLVPHLLELQGPPVGPFPGSEDVAGDSRLLVVAAPGHTPGHVGLLVRGRRTFLLAGDLAHSAAQLAHVAPAVADWCRDEGAVFLATHDTAAPALAGDAA
jgi:N-acyl homoserine lactone hydrolase